MGRAPFQGLLSQGITCLDYLVLVYRISLESACFVLPFFPVTGALKENAFSLYLIETEFLGYIDLVNCFCSTYFIQ